MKIKCHKLKCEVCGREGTAQLFYNNSGELRYGRVRHYLRLNEAKKPQFEYHKVEDLEALKTLLKSQGISLSTDKVNVGQSGQEHVVKIHDQKINNSGPDQEIPVPRWPSLVGRYLGKVMVAGSKPARGSTFDYEIKIGDFGQHFLCFIGNSHLF